MKKSNQSKITLKEAETQLEKEWTPLVLIFTIQNGLQTQLDTIQGMVNNQSVNKRKIHIKK